MDLPANLTNFVREHCPFQFLRYGALAAGVIYGAVHTKSLERFVAKQKEAAKSQLEADILDEARVVYQAEKDRDAAKQAAPISLDPDSYKYSAERHVEWGMQQLDKA